MENHVHTARTVSVEDTSNTNIDTILTLITVGQSLSDSFSFIIAGTITNRVDMTPAANIEIANRETQD